MSTEVIQKESLRPEYGWLLVATLFVACLALFVNVQVAFFAAVFGIVAVSTWMYSEYALLFLIILSPLLPMLKITQSIGTFTLAKDVVIFTLFIKYAVLPFIKQTLPYRRNLFLLPLLFLIGWTIVTTLRADSIVLGILRARDIGLYIVLYFAVLYMPLTKDFLKRCLTWFLGGFIALLILSIYQWFFAGDSAVLRFDPARSIWIPRISSTFAHPSVYGQYLVLVISVVTAVFLYTKNKATKGLMSVLFIAASFSVYLTYSRAVWFGYVAALASMALAYIIRGNINVHPVKKMWYASFASLALIIVLSFALFQFTPVGVFVRSAFDPNYASNKDRIEYATRLIGSTSNTDAFFGRGLGDVISQTVKAVEIDSFDIASGSSRSVQLSKDATLVDNQYLKTFIEMGALGILIYLWLYARAIKYTWKARDTIFGLAALGFFTSFILQAAFIDIWDVYPTNAAFWIKAAILSALSISIAKD